MARAFFHRPSFSVILGSSGETWSQHSPNPHFVYSVYLSMLSTLGLLMRLDYPSVTPWPVVPALLFLSPFYYHQQSIFTLYYFQYLSQFYLCGRRATSETSGSCLSRLRGLERLWTIMNPRRSRGLRSSATLRSWPSGRPSPCVKISGCRDRLTPPEPWPPPPCLVGCLATT